MRFEWRGREKEVSPQSTFKLSVKLKEPLIGSLEVNEELQLSLSKWVGVCNCNTAVATLRINGGGKKKSLAAFLVFSVRSL